MGCFRRLERRERLKLTRQGSHSRDGDRNGIDWPTPPRPRVLAAPLVRRMIIEDPGIPKRVRCAALGQIGLVLSVLSAWFPAVVVSVVGRIKSAIREATRPLLLVAGLALDLTRSRKALLVENAFLRQQLIVVSRRVKRPAVEPRERGLLVLLTGLVPRWRDAVLLLKPETILRWHREEYCLFWRHKSCRPSKPRPRHSRDVSASVGTSKRAKFGQAEAGTEVDHGLRSTTPSLTCGAGAADLQRFDWVGTRRTSRYACVQRW